MSDDDWLSDDLSTDTRFDLVSPRALSRSKVPCLTVIYHDDSNRIGEIAMLTGLNSGRTLDISRLEPAFGGPGRQRRPLADPFLSRRPWHLRPEGGEGDVELDPGACSTRLELDGERVEGPTSIPRRRLEEGAVIQLAESVVLLLHLRDPVPDRSAADFDLVGDSDAMLQLRRDIERVAPLDVPVLLRGETGTGKEMVARAIHLHGPRRDEPLVVVNMAAVPPSLAASELFGAERGAYTGAQKQRQGYFEQADGGTLFLDEIGETPEEVQPLLLRALETGEVQRVGGEGRHLVDVRLIAATDAELESRIAEGRFRAPLLHRLSGYDIRLPSLRERRDDIGRLYHYFLEIESACIERPPRSTDTGSRWLRGSELTRLALHDWPGNVRQLRNVVRQLAIIEGRAAPGELDRRLDDLLASGRFEEPRERGADSDDRADTDDREQAEDSRKSYRRPAEIAEEELLETLRAHQFRIQPSARALGVSRTSLYHLIERSDRLRKPADLGRDELLREIEARSGDLDAMASSLEVSRPGLEQRLRQLDLLERLQDS